MTIKEIRAITGLSQAAFGAKYHIPKRTIENWEGAVTVAPVYVTELLERAVKDDYIYNRKKD